MDTQKILEKILILLDPKEEIEYTLIEKTKKLDCLVLTNKKIIYTNLYLYNKNVFHYFDIKNNTTQKIERIKKTLQSDDLELNRLISTYFNINDEHRESVY